MRTIDTFPRVNAIAGTGCTRVADNAMSPSSTVLLYSAYFRALRIPDMTLRAGRAIVSDIVAVGAGIAGGTFPLVATATLAAVKAISRHSHRVIGAVRVIGTRRLAELRVTLVAIQTPCAVNSRIITHGTRATSRSSPLVTATAFAHGVCVAADIGRMAMAIIC